MAFSRIIIAPSEFLSINSISTSAEMASLRRKEMTSLFELQKIKKSE
jgi:hypothetical protein